MASWMETPIEHLEIGLVRVLAAPHEDPLSEIGPWVVLDPGVTLGQRWDDDGNRPAICDVIATWRAADRRLAGLAMNSPERDGVQAELVGLRALHHRLFDAQIAESPSGGGHVDWSSFGLIAWARGSRPAVVIA
jgi:hypothetical protein